MVKSKGWEREKVKGESEKMWKEPAEETYYLVQRWEKQEKKELLDIGCGLGRNTIFFAKQGFNVHTFDISEDAVKRTKEFAKEENVTIDIKQADMLNIPYGANTMDCVYSRNVISHTDTEGVKKIISEIYRVLKNEGECYLTLGSKDTWGYKQKSWPKVDDNTKIRQDEGPEYGVPHFYADYELIIDLFKDFKIIDIKHIKDFYKVNDKISTSYHYHILVKK